MRAWALVLAILFITAPLARAQGFAVDPNRPVRGSCGEVLQPLFAAARSVAPAPGQGIARFEVNVTRQMGLPGAPPEVSARAVTVQGLSSDQANVLTEVFRQAYLTQEQEGCVGVITRRARWLMRLGPAEAMWTPDDPLVINRAVAATNTADGRRIELVDPLLGRSRLAYLAGDDSRSQCHSSSPLRLEGILPPVDVLERSRRYALRFRLFADGRVGEIRMPLDLEVTAEQRAALEAYVRRARYYPQINQACMPVDSWVSISTSGRSES
jgi:hypothetical protein